MEIKGISSVKVAISWKAKNSKSMHQFHGYKDSALFAKHFITSLMMTANGSFLLFKLGAGGPHPIGNFGEVGCHQKVSYEVKTSSLRAKITLRYFSITMASFDYIF